MTSLALVTGASSGIGAEPRGRWLDAASASSWSHATRTTVGHCRSIGPAGDRRAV